MARASAGLGGSLFVQRVGQAANSANTTSWSGSAGYSIAGTGPNPANNGLLLTPLEVIGSGVRGTVPGLWHARSDWGSTFTTGTMVDGTDDMAGRRLLVVRPGAPAGSSDGTAFIDLTGPWSR